MTTEVLVLAYSGCDTCRKALRWLEQQGVAYRVRPIVEEPPTRAELAQWVPRSGLAVRKWLNTSGQSYRALGKERVEAASEEQLLEWLAADGKLVKRPVLVRGEQVLVGFKPEAYAQLFGRGGG
jgi:arsenate reductase (glutaredoxin)